MKIKKVRLNNIVEIPKNILLLIFTIIFTIYVRISNYGTNSLTGDELNTISYLSDASGKIPTFHNFIEFVLNQNRGPTQYVLNYINLQVFGYLGEYQLRLPYLFFALIAFASFYFLAKLLKNDSYYVVFVLYFYGINGLFIVFARISQYQSLILFLIPLIMYLFLKGYVKNELKYLIISGFIFSTAILTHFDSLSFISFS